MKMPFPSAEKAEIFPAFVENSDRNRHLHLLQYNILSMNIKKMSRLLVLSDDIFFNIILMFPFWLCVLYIFLFDFADKSYNSTQLSLYSVFVQKRKRIPFLDFIRISCIFQFLRQPYSANKKAHPLRTSQFEKNTPFPLSQANIFYFMEQIYSVFLMPLSSL